MTVFNHAEAIGDEIVRRLKLITVAQGAETGIGISVFKGVRRVDDSMLPCAVLVEGDDMPSRAHQVGTNYRIEQRYALLAYLPCDPKNPNVAAHAAIRDMKRVVFAKGGELKATFGDKVQKVTYLGRDIGARSDGLAFVVAAIEIQVDYSEDLAVP